MMLSHEGITLAGLEFDTMLASYVLDATRSSHTIEEVALEHLGYKALTQEDVCGTGQKATPLPHLPAAAILEFRGRTRRPGVAARREAARHACARTGSSPLFRDLEMPLVPVLAEIERHGVRIDLPALASQSQRIEAELASRSARIFELAGEEFNINSPKQLSVILFDKLQLPTAKRTGKTKVASTAVDVLEDLALTHELPKLILEWRALQKLKGTYIDALPQLVHSRTARVHTSFNQAVAATGRLSSSDPNLQNIPIRTDLGREIRRAFIADPGYVLISADYSQIELRVLAHLAEEEALVDAFRRGEDIHDRTALKVFGPTAASTSTSCGAGRRSSTTRCCTERRRLRWRAISASRRLSRRNSSTRTSAASRASARSSTRRSRRAQATGFVETMFGRRRMVPELNSRNGQIRQGAERMTVNFPIQGTAADILKRAMLRVHDTLRQDSADGKDRRARMILTVHDELLIESPAGVGRGSGRAGPRGDGGRSHADGAADRRCRHRAQLA